MEQSKSFSRARRALTGALLAAAALGFVTLSSTACRGEKKAGTVVEGTAFDISPEIIAANTAKVEGEDRADTLINLGTLTEGEVVRYDASLRNRGAEPLVVTGVTTTCGCTDVVYDGKPIAPGKTGALSFSLDSKGMFGLQMKLIDIKTSAADRPYTIMVMAVVNESK